MANRTEELQLVAISNSRPQRGARYVDLKTGHVIRTDSITSFTRNKAVTAGFLNPGENQVLLELTTRDRGTCKLYDISVYSMFPSEAEVAMPSDTELSQIITHTVVGQRIEVSCQTPRGQAAPSSKWLTDFTNKLDDIISEALLM